MKLNPLFLNFTHHLFIAEDARQSKGQKHLSACESILRIKLEDAYT